MVYMQKLSLDPNEELNQTSSNSDILGDPVRSGVRITEEAGPQSLVDAGGSIGENLPVENAVTSSQSHHTKAPTTTTMSKKSMMPLVIILGIALLAGLATGYGGFRLQSKNGGSLVSGLTGEEQPIQQVATGTVKAGDVFGVQDASTFKDSAEGTLQEGGIGGEGSHQLAREGGVTQTVVLTSSVTDLSKFTGMQVKVWGETFKAQKAGWLMDVGRVEVVNPEVVAPVVEE
jgi:hypothetical protein